jgi:CHASE2 domain-containing sensor protein
MNNQSLYDTLTALAVVALLLLTAWGNAMAMFLVAAVGLAALVFLTRKRTSRGRLLAAAVGSVVAIGISWILLLQ